MTIIFILLFIAAFVGVAYWAEVDHVRRETAAMRQFKNAVSFMKREHKRKFGR